MLALLLRNHILANGVFIVCLLAGAWAYTQLSREQEPSVNFNWVTVVTTHPGASPSDIEERVTNPLEEAIAKVSDLRFVSSSSREGVSTITVRFADVSDVVYKERVADLRRELQNRLDELPQAASNPEIYESSSSNLLPTAIVLVVGSGDEEALRRQVTIAEEDIERFPEVDYVDMSGEQAPELQVLFKPEKLVGFGISPADLAETVRAYFRDVSAGDIDFGDQSWRLRVRGTSLDPVYLESLSIVTAKGEVPLRSVAEVRRGRGDATELVRHRDDPAVMLEIFKKDEANLLELVDRLKAYIADRNRLASGTGVRLVILDDRTEAIERALSVMESNALIGFVLILVVTWFFLGSRIALVTSIGLPFILAGVFLVLYLAGLTLNVVVLLGLMISLGMLVDDSVVVAEAVGSRRLAGMRGDAAILDGLRSVAAPVTAAVLTTAAAFVPLAFVSGVLGDYMRVIPIVVVSALAISLLEAFWLLPVHLSGLEGSVAPRRPTWRKRVNAAVRRVYLRVLAQVLRRPFWLSLVSTVAVGVMAGAVVLGILRVDPFAGENASFFYVNVDMPPGTNLARTLEAARAAEAHVRTVLSPQELRASAAYSGIQFSDAEPFMGARHGQVFVSLDSSSPSNRSVDQIIEALRATLPGALAGPQNVSFLVRRTGPPTEKAINVKVRGDDFAESREAAQRLKALLADMAGVSDVGDDDIEGGTTVELRLEHDAVTRAGVNPASVIDTIALLGRGVVVASVPDQGERVHVRVRADDASLSDLRALLSTTLATPSGSEVPLSRLVRYSIEVDRSNIRHFNFRRAITVTANLDTQLNDAVSVNNAIREHWAAMATQYPNVELTFSTLVDDINESLQSLALLFAVSLALIYLILGTQFQSYTQPLVVLTAVPLALVGVVLGLIASGNPLSLYTLYAVIALAGIVVNTAIMMLTAANRYLEAGHGPTAAVMYAARQRVIPIIITTVTTIAGLVGLAAGWGGESAMWSPVATAIVWGLGFSTLLGLLFLPVLMRSLLVRKARQSSAKQSLFGSGPWFQLLRLLGRRNVLGHSRSSRSPDPAAGDPRLSEGLQALEAGELESAIRLCESVARDFPDSVEAQLAAAGALTAIQQRYGWDVGYDARARRHLARVRALDPSSANLVRLETALAALADAENDNTD